MNDNLYTLALVRSGVIGSAFKKTWQNFTRVDIEKALNKLKARKVAGFDGMVAKYMKKGGKEACVVND